MRRCLTRRRPRPNRAQTSKALTKVFFVRADHWWYSKVAPPLMLLMALLSAAVSPATLFEALATLSLVVSLVGNFGYALNEIFDVEEDTKANKRNIAILTGALQLWTVAAVCLIAAAAVAYFAIGGLGFTLTLFALSFPLAYSAPPLRLKERKWLGVLADALAVHVYPAVLCLLIGTARAPQMVGTTLIASTIGWALAFGLRGILTHQIIDEERDRTSGLVTVVHIHGRGRVIAWVKYAVAPVEIVCLLLIFAQVEIGAVFYGIVVIYLGGEALKLAIRWNGTVFSHEEQPYIPFLNNAFYETWGSFAVALDIAVREPMPLLLLPAALIILFWPRFLAEARMIGALAYGIARRARARARC